MICYSSFVIQILFMIKTPIFMQPLYSQITFMKGVLFGSFYMCWLNEIVFQFVLEKIEHSLISLALDQFICAVK